MLDAERVLSASPGKKRVAMQLPPEEQEFIRRAFHVEHKLIRQIEQETGHSCQAIRRAISYRIEQIESLS
jgi:hypothetical protein